MSDAESLQSRGDHVEREWKRRMVLVMWVHVKPHCLF